MSRTKKERDNIKAVAKKLNIPTEHEEQVAFLNWWKFQFPNIRIIAVPNGLRTSMKQAIKAKREGVSKGFPDLLCVEMGLAIEFKRTKGGVLSAEQKDWHVYLEERCGYIVIVGYGCEDAINKVMDFIKQFDTENQ